MKKKLKMQVICVALAGCIAATAFAGCGGKTEETGVEGSATSVAYNSQGVFTTTVTASDVKFAENIKADDITVNYMVLDETAINNAQSAAETDDYYSEVKAQVQSVVRQDEKTLVISFTDSQAAVNTPYSYDVEINKSKTGVGKVIYAASEVDYPDNSVTANVQSVSMFDNDVRLTLELNEGEYVSNVTKEQITLDGAFENLTIASISSAGKNLTMQLTGDIAKEEKVNAYLDGFVTIAKEAITDGYRSVDVKIPVDTACFGVELEKMTVTNGQVSVPVTVGGYRFNSGANASDVQIEGFSVADFKVESETSAVLKLNLSEANDKNGAASILNGKDITFSADALGMAQAVSFEMDFNHADFYPVFDYADEKDGKYAITLMLYANSGSFAKSLTNDMVALAGDFATATITSFKRENDTTAELVLFVNSNGVKVEDMDLSGTVTLQSGALISRWGDAYLQDCSYTREYTQDSMGKSATDGLLDNDYFGDVKNLINKFNDLGLDKVIDIGSGIVSAANGVVSFLEMVGVIESDSAKLDKIYSAIMDVNKQLKSIKDAIEDQNAKTLAEEILTFITKALTPMIMALNDAQSYVQDAKKSLKDNGVNQPAQELEYQDVNGENKCISSQKLQNEWRDYLCAVMQQVRKDRAFDFVSLKDRFEDVCAYLVEYGNGLTSILDKFDQHIVKQYNFDTAAYNARENFRTTIKAHVSLVAIMLCAYNQYGFDTPQDNTIKNLKKCHGDAMAYIDSKPVVHRTDGKVLMVQHDIEIKNKLINFCALDRAIYANKTKKNFTDEEIEQFIKLMGDRTIDEELELAGITVKGLDGENAPIGVAFNCWGNTSKNRGTTVTRYYAKLIYFGKNNIAQSQTYVGFGRDELKTYFSIWYAAV